VPLNNERNALVRDDKGEPLVWVVQMESAAQANKDGITREAFPQGTVFSIGLHPRPGGKPPRGRRPAGMVRVSERQQAGARQALRLGRRGENVRRGRITERRSAGKILIASPCPIQ